MNRGVICRRATATVAATAALAAAPAPAATGPCGTRPWCDPGLPADVRAGLLVDVMNVAQKEAVLSDNAVPELGIPKVNRMFTDGPVGAPAQVNALSRPATALPSDSALGATFDLDLARRYGDVIGNDAQHYGYYGTYAPTLNILRTPFAGRGEEYYGEDPFLVSEMGVQVTRGIQAHGIVAQIKHFVANDQEGQLGVTPSTGLVGGRMLTNVHVDERTLREVYLAPFEAAIRRGGAGSVMCSYNRLNGQYSCENGWLLEHVLRHDWGFKGWVGPDFGANHNPIENFNNGMDFYYSAPQEIDALLATALANEGTLTEHTRRMLRSMFAAGYFDRPLLTDRRSQIDKPAEARVAQQVAEDGAVLLRNEGNLLPLDTSKIKSIAVVGPAADIYQRASGSMEVTAFHKVKLLAGIQARAAKDKIKVTTDRGLVPSYAADLARKADVAIVAVNDHQTEGDDKLCISLSCPGIGIPDGADLQQQYLLQDELIEQVAKANPRTIVVLQTGSPILTPWRTRVRGLLQAWYPGQEGGTAIARVLFGDAEPGGRLPSTFPAEAADGYATSLTRDPLQYPGTVDEYYKEGVLVGYRWYDAQHEPVAYPFGFGLSYTTFSYSGMRVKPARDHRSATVSVTVRNTGRRPGSDVPQVYVGLPAPSAAVAMPARKLAAFAKVRLAAGASKRVTMRIGTRSLSYWGTAAQTWRPAAGCARVYVARSSREIVAERTLAVAGKSCPHG